MRPNVLFKIDRLNNETLQERTKTQILFFQG